MQAGRERCVPWSLIEAPVPQDSQRTEEAWVSFQEQSGVLQVRSLSTLRAGHPP